MTCRSAVLPATGVAAWCLAHRTSPFVRRWQPSSLPRRTGGPLSVLDSGHRRSGDDVLVLLHGLGATGDYFGDLYDDLARSRRVLIVDVLGFGMSLDEERTAFSLDDHVDAIDDMLEALGLGAADVTLAAHSMSTAIALAWAQRHSERAAHVYLWGPPIYPRGTAADRVVNEYGPMGRLFVLDTKWAQLACRFNCANRRISGMLMAAVSPRWPVAVSRRAALHTWEAYRQSVSSLITNVNWRSVLPADVPVTVFRGVDDPVGDRRFLTDIAGTATIVDVKRADHHVAVQRPDLLRAALTA